MGVSRDKPGLTSYTCSRVVLAPISYFAERLTDTSLKHGVTRRSVQLINLILINKPTFEQARNKMRRLHDTWNIF